MVNPIKINCCTGEMSEEIDGEWVCIKMLEPCTRTDFCDIHCPKLEYLNQMVVVSPTLKGV